MQLSRYLCLAFLFSTTVAFSGNSSPENMRGEPLLKDTYTEGCAMPAAIFVDNPVHMHLSASFLYYDVQQSGMEIASGATNVQLPSFSYATAVSDNQKIFTQKSEYSPGFKVGIGGVVGNWDLLAEYSWIHTNTTSNFTPPNTSFGAPVLVSHNWFQSLSLNNTPLSATNIQSNWKVQLNILDLLIARPMYVSPHFIFTLVGGLRSMLIYQHLNIDFTEAPNTVASMPEQPIHSLNKSTLWGVGPKFGAMSYLLLPNNFRLQGNIAFSLLFSHNEVHHTEDASSTNQIPQTIDFSVNAKGYIKDIIEMGLGFGWGTYVAQNRYHIDFSASYDFAIFADQNIMKRTLDGFLTQSIGTPLNLYIQGLNITFSLDF